MATNQANAKQHPEAELLLFENYSHSSSKFSSKDNSTYYQKQAKKRSMSLKMLMKIKSRSLDKTKIGLRLNMVTTMYKKCLGIMIEAQFMRKSCNTEGELKIKALLIKKVCIQPTQS